MDHRGPLLTLLEKYKALDAADQERANRLHTFVVLNKNCFERSNVAGHITGSAWLVNKTGDRVLLTHHKKLGRWLQLGGHADGEADVLSVAAREAREESGLVELTVLSDEIFDLDVHLIAEHGLEPEHFHFDIRFLLQSKSSEEFKVSPESNKLAWVSIEQMENVVREPSLLRMRQKWLMRKHLYL